MPVIVTAIAHSLRLFRSLSWDVLKRISSSTHEVHLPRSRGGTHVLASLMLLASLTLSAQTIPLGVATSFGVLGASAVTSTGSSVVVGDLGISPNTSSSVTGFTFSTPPGAGQVIGTTHFADAVALTAKNNATTAYTTAAGRACSAAISADLGGSTLAPGVYCATSSMGLTGTLTLDAQGNRDAVFVFQVGSALTTASASQVRVINGGQNCNVFWQIGSSATLGTGSSFAGNILALTSITMNTGSSNNGRAIALNGAVTLDSSNVTTCTLAVNNPTVSMSFAPSTISAGASSMLTLTMTNPNLSVATLIAAMITNLPPGVVIAPLPNASSTCGAAVVSAVAGASAVSVSAGATIPSNGSCSMTVSVVAAVGGTYVVTAPVGALTTSNGSNVAPSVATLTVIPAVVAITAAPLLGKSFTPTTINTGGISTLSITLSNPNNTVATLTAPLVDTLPSGVVIANPTGASTTCGASLAIALSGSTSVTLPTGATIPSAGSCVVSVNVTAGSAGTYLNTLNAGALATSNGVNASPALATLTAVLVAITPPVISPPVILPAVSALPQQIPSLSVSAIFVIMLMLLVAGCASLRQRAR